VSYVIRRHEIVVACIDSWRRLVYNIAHDLRGRVGTSPAASATTKSGVKTMDLNEEIRETEHKLAHLKECLEEHIKPLQPWVVRDIMAKQNEEILALKKTMHSVVAFLHEKFPHLAQSAKLPISIEEIPF
jgi:hypothetical protein